jgi:NADH:ubiquinone oxidoreductase subunit H
MAVKPHQYTLRALVVSMLAAALYLGGVRAICGPDVFWYLWSALVFVLTMCLAAAFRPEPALAKPNGNGTV